MTGGGLSVSGRGMGEYRNLDWINTSLTINEWYTALATTRNVRVWYLVVEQTNNGAAAEILEVELTIDGAAPITRSVAAVSGTADYIYIDWNGALVDQAAVVQLLSLDNDQSAPLETRSLQVRVRQTSDVDATSAQIEVNMVYQTIEWD